MRIMNLIKKGEHMLEGLSKMALILTLLIFWVGCGGDVEEKKYVRPVRAIKVADISGITSGTFPGQARAEDRVNLSFRLGGPLIERPVNVGDKVKKGGLIARIDPRDFEVNLRNAEGALGIVNAELNFAVSDYDRALKILKEDPGAISMTLVDRKREDVNRLKAQTKSLTAQVDGAKDALSYTYLKAPLDGEIVATYVENFEDVLPKQPIVRLLDTSSIEMVIDIPENMISAVPYVEDITVSFDPFPGREFTAKIIEIGGEASKTTRTYPVTLLISQPGDVRILPGMAGSARASAKLPQTIEDKGKHEIPLSAVFSNETNDKSFVWVIDKEDMTIKRREVKPGRITNRGILIDEGIEEGEWIATAGVNYLKEGQKIRILGESANQKESDSEDSTPYKSSEEELK
jgi:RND family efflux transporter MFP subunit